MGSSMLLAVALFVAPLFGHTLSHSTNAGELNQRDSHRISNVGSFESNCSFSDRLNHVNGSYVGYLLLADCKLISGMECKPKGETNVLRQIRYFWTSRPKSDRKFFTRKNGCKSEACGLCHVFEEICDSLIDCRFVLPRDIEFSKVGNIASWRLPNIGQASIDFNMEMTAILGHLHSWRNFPKQPRPLVSDENITGQSIGISGGHYRGLHIAGLSSSSAPSVPRLFLASKPEQNGRDRQSAGENDEPKREESDRIARSALPKGFAFLSLVVFFFSGLVTFLLLGISRSIGSLPTQNSNPKNGSDEKS